MRTAGAIFASVLALGCGEREPPRPSRRFASLDPARIPPATASGVVDDAPFTLRDAWFRVDHRAARARVDLLLSEGRATRLCAGSEPEDARHLWVRLAGVTEPTPGDLRGDALAGAAVSAHWESRASGRWTGRPGIVALRLESVSPTLLVGRIHACFGSGEGGCVAGAFQARRCVTELDPDGPLAGMVRRPERDGGPAP